MVDGIAVVLALTTVLAIALPWALIPLVYVAQLRSRKSGQRAQLARDLGISTLALNNSKVVKFFHPFW